MLDAGLVDFVTASLPDPPARVLEIGAGAAGELAQHLSAAGYDVVAIDPASQVPHVKPVALDQLEAEDGDFDAAVAVLSLHHVEPLERSCERLAGMLRPGAVLVIDEFDTATFDVRAARWWLERAPTVHLHGRDAEAVATELHRHLHPLTEVLAALEPWFELGPVERLPYLYRWQLDPAVRPLEEEAIARSEIDATGARLVGRRRA
jgi:SAM-dependent methyltransferase